MSRNPWWFDQMRARALCYICHRAMADDDPRRVHKVCQQEVNRGRRWADVRNSPPSLDPPPKEPTP